MQERFVPGTWSELTTYEHLPRYRYAQALAEGRRVLDFGSGTGYGSALLAEVAESVTAVDIDDGALGYAREVHLAPNLRFGKEAALGRSLPDASFELIVCFEVIEHLSADDQKILIEQFGRLITADGIVLISTPNPDVTKRYGHNPYHLHEMSFEEFTTRLSERFEVVKPLRQQINAGISLSDAAAPNSPYLVMPLQDTTDKDPAAFLALCSHTPFDAPPNVIYQDHERDFIADRTDALRRNNTQLIELYQAKSSAALAQFGPDRTRLQSEIGRLASALEAERAATAQLRQDVAEAEANHTAMQKEISSVRWERNVLQQELHQVYSSTSWRLLSRVFPYLRGIAPVAKPPLRLLKKAFRAWKGRSHSTEVLPTSATPVAAPEPAPTLDLEFETSLEPVWDTAQGAYQLKPRSDLSEKPVGDGHVGPYVLHAKYQTLLSNRRKVLHVIPNVYVGGSTQLIIDIVEHLGDEFDHVVLTSALWPGGEHQGIVVHRRNWDEMVSVPELLRQVDPDLVHMHYWGLSDDPWYDGILKSMDVLPRVKILENINTPTAPKLHPRINHLVYVSDYVRREFHPPIARLDATSIVHPGIDLSAFNTPFSGDDADNAIGMVYRLEGDKLRIDAIELFIRVAQLRPRTRIYVVGGGTFLETYIRRTVEAGARNNFCFTGYRPYAELPGWYDKFCMFVAPVWKESFGQVSPFGMAKQQVVAGYDIGALEEIIGTKEHLADDLEALAHKIVDLLDDPERRRDIGLYNRSRATAMFDVHTMVAEYRRIYGELLKD